MSDFVGDICTENFFILLSQKFQAGSVIRLFIADNSYELASHMKYNYSMLPSIKGMGDDANIHKLVYARFGKSLERIATALTDLYNPLHNTDVEEHEENSGEDTHNYGGSDVTTLTRSHQTTDYSQTSNSALTSGSTYDDTNEANMKPISKTTHEFVTNTEVDATGETGIDYGKSLTMGYGREVTKTKKGNIGVMPTQQLMELEYYDRFRLILFEAIVRACTTTISSGVWEE